MTDFIPVARMAVVRPCSEAHPNAIPWDTKYRSAGPLCKILYDSMGWDTDYSFRVPCQTVSAPDGASAVLVFDLDNYVGRASGRKDEAIIADRGADPETEPKEESKSYYYPPDESEPQEIRDMEEKFRQAVETNRKLFGTPVFQHTPGIRGLTAAGEADGWDMMAAARPLDVSHTVDSSAVNDLLLQIMDDPPALPHNAEDFPDAPIIIDDTGKEG